MCACCFHFKLPGFNFIIVTYLIISLKSVLINHGIYIVVYLNLVFIFSKLHSIVVMKQFTFIVIKLCA